MYSFTGYLATFHRQVVHGPEARTSTSFAYNRRMKQDGTAKLDHGNATFKIAWAESCIMTPTKGLEASYILQSLLLLSKCRIGVLQTQATQSLVCVLRLSKRYFSTSGEGWWPLMTISLHMAATVLWEPEKYEFSCLFFRHLGSPTLTAPRS